MTIAFERLVIAADKYAGRLTHIMPIRIVVDRILRRRMFGYNRFSGRHFYGAYPSFAEAARQIPDNARSGYAIETAARMYDRRMERLFSSDYPVVFWLATILSDLRGTVSLFDYGGHVGIAAYAYTPYLPAVADLDWKVCDVPTVCRAGEALAREKQMTNLTFTTRFSDAEGVDVLLAAGSLQYIETPLAESIATLISRPRHLIINKTPLYDGEPVVTINNMYVSHCLYRLDNRQRFLASLEALGYQLINRWENDDLLCEIPLHPECALSFYDGMYLRLDPT